MDSGCRPRASCLEERKTARSIAGCAEIPDRFGRWQLQHVHVVISRTCIGLIAVWLRPGSWIYTSCALSLSLFWVLLSERFLSYHPIFSEMRAGAGESFSLSLSGMPAGKECSVLLVCFGSKWCGTQMACYGHADSVLLHRKECMFTFPWMRGMGVMDHGSWIMDHLFLPPQLELTGLRCTL